MISSLNDVIWKYYFSKEIINGNKSNSKSKTLLETAFFPVPSLLFFCATEILMNFKECNVIKIFEYFKKSLSIKNIFIPILIFAMPYLILLKYFFRNNFLAHTQYAKK